MYELAERLGQPLQTVLDMTVEEYQHWFTFLKVKAELQRKHSDGKGKGRRPGNIRSRRA